MGFGAGKELMSPLASCAMQEGVCYSFTLYSSQAPGPEKQAKLIGKKMGCG